MRILIINIASGYEYSFIIYDDTFKIAREIVFTIMNAVKYSGSTELQFNHFLLRSDENISEKNKYDNSNYSLFLVLYC